MGLTTIPGSGVTVHEFTIGDLGRYLELFDELQITVWLDGGWAVDALLGEQTRSHADLDIAIQKDEVEMLRTALVDCGFAEIDTDDRTEWNFVMANDSGLQIDFHVIEIDTSGRGIYGPPEDGLFYPATSLRATGVVSGRNVRCISAEFQVQSRAGYKLEAKGLADVKALHERYGIPLPAEYECLQPPELDTDRE